MTVVFVWKLADVRVLSVLVNFVDAKDGSSNIFDLAEKIKDIESICQCPEAFYILKIDADDAGLESTRVVIQIFT